MTKRYLQHIYDGTIYAWDPILAENPKCREVPEHIAFPQKVIEAAEKAQPPAVAAKQKGRPKKDLGITEMEATVTAAETPVAFTTDDFHLDVGKGWPK